MIPRFRPAVHAAELAAAWSPSTAGDVAGFEKAFSDRMGLKESLAFPYGRTGLLLLLEAMGLKDREVIMPAYTCVVVAHAVVLSGNRPVFVDSRPEDFNMDLELADKAVGPRTGALIATSIFGHPVDLEALDVFRKKHPDVRIIQDCAHSFGADWKGRPVQAEGDAALFGLNVSKIMTSIFGGMVSTNGEALAVDLRRLRDRRVRPPSWTKSWKRRFYVSAIPLAFWPPLYGLVNRMERSGLLDHFVRYYDEGLIDMPADHLEGMTGLEARVGRVQTGRYAGILARRRASAERYFSLLSGIPGLRPPPRNPGSTFSHFTVRVEDPEKLLSRGLRAGVQFGRIIDYSIPEMKAYQGAGPACPQASAMAKTAVNLPLFVGDREAERVADLVRGSCGT